MIADIDPAINIEQVTAFVARWRGNSSGEMRVAQQHFLELCAALSVPAPDPSAPVGVYGFEQPVTIPGGGDHSTTTERMDVYRPTRSGSIKRPFYHLNSALQLSW